MLRKSTPGISAPKWAVVSHRCRQKAESYTKHLTLRQTVQQSINSQVKQLQSQHLHLNTLSGVTLQPLALPRQKKPNYFKNVPLGVFLSPQAVTSFSCNLLLDIHSSETCLGLHRSLVFYTTIHSLSSSTISWVLDQDSELSTSLASAQHSHQSPLEVPRGHHALISCAGISHLSRSCKTNLHVPWRFLIPCPV